MGDLKDNYPKEMRIRLTEKAHFLFRYVCKTQPRSETDGKLKSEINSQVACNMIEEAANACLGKAKVEELSEFFELEK